MSIILENRKYYWGIVFLGEIKDLDEIREKLPEIIPENTKILYEETSPSKLILLEK